MRVISHFRSHTTKQSLITVRIPCCTSRREYCAIQWGPQVQNYQSESSIWSCFLILCKGPYIPSTSRKATNRGTMRRWDSRKVSVECCRSIYDSYVLNVKPSQIANYHEMPVSTVRNIIRRISTARTKNKQGRQSKLYATLLVKLDRFLEVNSFLLLDKLGTNFSAVINDNISKSTLCWYVKRIEFYSCVVAAKLFISEKNVMRYTLWGLMHFDKNL